MIQKWPPFAYTCLYKKKWTKNWQIPPQCVGQIDNCTTLYYQRHWFGQKQLIHSFTEELRSNLKKRILSSLAKNLWKFLLAIFIDQINLYSYLVLFSISYSQWTPHWCHTCCFGFKHIIAMVGQKKNSGAVRVLLSRSYLDFILILSWFYPDFIQILSR